MGISGTEFDIDKQLLPLISTDYQQHQHLRHLLGTSVINADVSRIQHAVKRYVQHGDLHTALRIQILSDYASWPRAVIDYQKALELVIRHI